MTINKDEFITLISEKAGFTKKDGKAFLDAFIESVEEVLAQPEGAIQLVGFGKFGSREVAEKSGICKLQKDANGVAIETPFTTEAHKQPFFKVGKGLKDKINL